MSYVDYTVVIASCISGFSAITAAVLSAWIARQVRAPSKRRLGELVEETHTITSSRVAAQLERLDRAQQAEHDNGEGAE